MRAARVRWGEEEGPCRVRVGCFREGRAEGGEDGAGGRAAVSGAGAEPERSQQAAGRPGRGRGEAGKGRKGRQPGDGSCGGGGSRRRAGGRPGLPLRRAAGGAG